MMSNTSFLLPGLLLVAGCLCWFGVSATAASTGQLCFVGFSILLVLDLQARRKART